MFQGTSGDSFFLIFVRMVTLMLGIVMTRVLSDHFSLHEYGTYSQVMLLITTVSSMTTLGMMDGINFFFCKESDERKRDAYVSTIFFLQYTASTIVSITVLACSVPIAKYFGNESLKSLMIYAAVLPAVTNTIYLLQVLFIAIGKAKQIAIRNLIVSLLKLGVVTLACYVFDSIAVIFFSQVITDLLQVLYFMFILRKHNCKINALKFDASLIKEILTYCIPMAMFAVIKSLNRESDKLVISFFTNTETLAVYANASKLLPFDIIMTSFCTVLLPYFTRYLAKKKYDVSQILYKSFLELSYIATTVLAAGAICVAPELMRFLYTAKYTAADFSIAVFVIYIVVDIFSFMNMTLILSAAGKTKTIMLTSIGAFFANILLNIALYFILGEMGPALATLIVTLIQGVALLALSAKELQSNLRNIFNFKYMAYFAVQLAGCFMLALLLRNVLLRCGLHYMLVLMIVYAFFCGTLLILNLRRLLKNLKTINTCKLEQ